MSKKILARVLAMMSLLAVLLWLSGFGDYQDCLDDETKNNNKCFEDYLMQNPEIQETQDLAEACDEADAECLLKISEMKIKKDLENGV